MKSKYFLLKRLTVSSYFQQLMERMIDLDNSMIHFDLKILSSLVILLSNSRHR